MELEHTFTVAVPVDQAWDVLQELERIVPCMPGASLTSHTADEFTGTVKVKLGPVAMTFAGQGRFVERDLAGRRIVVEASGKDRKGGGTARAAIRATLRDEGGQTGVDVHSDLVVTGRAAQFGRGMIAEVSNRLLAQFTDCLAAELGTGGGGDAAARVATAGGGDGAVAAAGAAGQAAAAGQAGAAGQAAAPAEAGGSGGGATGAGAAAASGQPEPGETGQPGAGSVARVPRQAEPIDLLGVTGIRATTARLVPYLVVFVAGVLVGAGLLAWLG